MTEQPAAKRPGPGRPRRSDVEDTVTRAVLGLLREVAYSALTYDMIGERAGVSKPTMYRRWSSKAALVADVIARSSPDYPPPPPPDRLREWLHDCFVGTYLATRDAGVMNVIPSIVGEMSFNSELRSLFWEGYTLPRRRMLEEVLTRGVADGVLRADLDVSLMVPILGGPLMFGSVIDGQPLDDKQANVVFDEMWAAISTPAAAGSRRRTGAKRKAAR